MSKEIAAALSAPFEAKDLKQRPGRAGLVFTYADARAVAQRLDDVLGIAGWQFEVKVADPARCVVHGSLALVIDGSTTTPAVGLRASTNQLTNVDNLDIDTKGLDISVSKGFVMFTPYAGAGVVRVSGETSGLRSSTTLNKFFVGVGMNLLALNVNIEYDKTGDVPSYSAKLGLRL